MKVGKTTQPEEEPIVTRTNAKSIVKDFITAYPQSSMAEIAWEVYAADKTQSHDRCMSLVVSIVSSLLEKQEVIQEFNSSISVYSLAS